MTKSNKAYKCARALMFSFIFAVVLITTASAANLGGGKVTASSLNFRSEASTSATILACVGYDTPLVIAEKVNDEWYAVFYEGVKGYMNSSYIERVSTLDFNVGEGRILGNSVRLRSGPSLDAQTLTYLYQDEPLSVIGVDNDWYKVVYKGTTGYIHSDYIKLTKASSVSRSVSSEGQAIVDWAKEFLGTPYVYGGSSPRGFDCSGFTYYLFNNSGYEISRCASSQWYDGEKVSKDELMVGDLVFFSSSGSTSIEHVGIYIGDGQFIHSSSGGDCVKINDLSDSYYSLHWYGAVRVIS